jgi:ParB/RepB/Spo0J family partition protein
MNEAVAQVVPIDSIEVEQDFNPRRSFDERELAELEASIRQSGVVSPPAVRPDGKGGYILIAGQRRLIAAKRAGLRELPVLVRGEDDALAAAIAENLIRADLDPIEEANALSRLAEAEGLGTHRKLAARVGKSSAYVSERLRLLALPESVQVQIAAGKVPAAAERELRKVAKVCPAVADCAAKLVARGEIEGRDLIERFDEVLYAVAESEMPGAPTMIDVARGVRISELIADPEQQGSLAQRLRAAHPYEKSEDPFVRFADADVDAARAAGCLLEYEVDHGEWSSSLAYLCDSELAADLTERAVKRIEKEAAKRAKGRGLTAGAAANGDDPESSAEQEAEERRLGREEAKRDAERARTANLELGRKLIARRGAATRKEHSLARAKALAEVVLADNPNLAARGLRLVLPQLQDVETKTLRSGENRETVTYNDAAECEGYLRKRIAEAKTDREVLELLADAMIAALCADQRELPASRRINWWHSAERPVAKALGTEIKSVSPRRARRK